MLDVLRLVISKAEELLQLFNHGRFRPGTYSLNLVGVRTQTTSFNNMPQVLNRLLTKKALLMFHKQLFHTQFIKHCPQVLHVLLNGGTKYQVYSHTAGYV